MSSFLVLLATLVARAVAAQTPIMTRDDRWLLAEARERGLTTVTLVLASRPRANAAVVAAVQAVGGTLRRRNDTLDYVRARVPVTAVDRLVASAPIEAVAVDVLATAPGPQLMDSLQRSNPITERYHPWADMGAQALLRAHPTYDGRGVVVGHVEWTPSLLVPELHDATTLDGRPVAKVVDYYFAGVADDEPVTDDEPSGPRWVPLPTQVSTAVAGTFTYMGTTYTAPQAGTFRVGTYDPGTGVCAWLGLPPRSSPAGAACPFTVLWDTASGAVWLDTDRDRRFTNERAVRAYRVAHEMGVLGHDNPATRQRESYSFVIQPDPAIGQVAILLGVGSHATMVATSAVGSRGATGLYDGVAPGAQLIEIVPNTYTVGGVIDALIAAFRDPRVDLVLDEAGGGQAGSEWRHEWVPDPLPILVQRLIAVYRKPHVQPAGNGRATSNVIEVGQNRDDFIVGASQGRESYRINDGLLVQHADNLHHVSSWGPSADGSIHPDILAPSNFLSSFVESKHWPTYLTNTKPGFYRLPPRYLIGGGTSQSTPSMAGALALLMSAAKQAHVPYDAHRIWRAVTNSARFVPHLGAYQQGNGIVDVAAAFALLQQYATYPPAIEIVSRGPVRVRTAGGPPVPAEGVGLWEREGWTAGMHGTRVITLTRTTGPTALMTFTLNWLGNDAGTFHAPATVTLPLGTPVSIPVAIAPSKNGMHSALLQLDHPSVPGHVARILTAIVAAERATAAHQSRITIADTLAWPGPSYTYYIDVPQGTGALAVSLTGTPWLRLDLYKPDGDFYKENRGTHDKLVSAPTPGVWEVVVEILDNTYQAQQAMRWHSSSRDRVDPPLPITVTVQLIGVTTTLRTPMASLTPKQQTTLTVDLENTGGAFTGGVLSTALGSGRVTRGTLAAHEQRTLELMVPVGAPLLDVALTAPATVTMTVYDCTHQECSVANTQRDPSAMTHFQKRNPRAGRWRLVLDAPTAAAAYEVRDLVLDPALGGVVSTDVARAHPVGDRWSATLSVWQATAPPVGRTPYLAILTEGVVAGAKPALVSFLTVPLQGPFASLYLPTVQAFPPSGAGVAMVLSYK